MGTDSTKGKLFKGLSSQTLITVIMGVLNIAVFSVMSRLLSKEVFGYYAALWAVVTIFQSISEAGLGSAVIQKKDCSESYYSSAFTLSFVLSITLSIILFFFAPLLARLIANDYLTTPLRFLSVILITTSLESVGRGALIRRLQFLKYGILQILSYVLSYGIGIYLAIKGYGLYSLVVAALLNSTIICILVYTVGAAKPRFHLNKDNCKEIFSFGGWLTASVLVNQFTVQLDKLVLSKWLSVSALGAYSRPSGFISSINDKINSIIDTTLFPILSSVQDETSKISNALYRSVGVLNSFSSVLSVFFFFNAELIIIIFFGDKWLDLVWVFRVISIGVLFSLDARLIDCFFRSLGLVKLNFYLRLLCMIIMVGSLYIGAKYGLLTTAIAVVCANAISVIIKMGFLCRRIGVDIKQLIKSFVLSLRPTVLIILAGIPFILVDTGIVFKIIMVFLLGAIVLVEFFFYPQMVGHLYMTELGEYINTIKARVHNKVKKI